ncbi:hypothetical protein [Rhizobium sp. 62_C5_N11_2]|uniref:hypothetical protein n=1 Tax=Rhizobium sp. 62_C5_N11_2 TaxID=3240772 RepID=UPI003F2686C1
MIAETENTLDGRNGPGAHALPSWPSSPQVLPAEAARRRGGVLFGPKEAGLEGLRERTLAEKKADFENIRPLNGALPLPSWVTPPTPSNRLSSARSSTSSIERSDGFSTRRTSISGATSRASMETTGLPYPSGIATAISISIHRPTGLKKLNASAPGRTPEKLAYATAGQVSVHAGLKPTKIEIVTSGRATLAPTELLSDRGERSRERDSHSR